MKLNKITLAIVAAAVAPLTANAGVTVSPLLLGYHYTGQAQDGQRKVLKTGRFINVEKQSTTNQVSSHNSGVTMVDGLYTGAAIGIELTPSTQFQVEYGVSNADARSSKATWDNNRADARYDAKQETISGNFLVGMGSGAFRPYVLVGAGQSTIKVENQNTYPTEVFTTAKGKKFAKLTNTGLGLSDTAPYAPVTIPAGTLVAEEKNVIGNLGLGAMYRINDALSLRGEGRAIYNVDHEWWEGMALAGLEVVLGGHKGAAVPVAPIVEPEPADPIIEEPVDVVVIPEPEPEPQPEIDSDADGVVDSLDACPGTATNLVVDARGCPRQVPVDDNLRMELRVFFDNDKSKIKAQYKPEIAKVAEKMREYPNSVARIEGHASKTGPSARYNQRLSEARAVAVKSMLANEFGVNPGRLTTQGFGYSRPIAPNDTEEGRAMNRRVYAIITGNKTVNVTETKDMR